MRVRNGAVTSRWLLEARDCYVDKRLRARKLYNDVRYHSRIDPYELVTVDPTTVTRSMIPFDEPNRKVAGTVVGGSWDRETYDFGERDGEFHMYVLESFEQRFVEGREWEETRYYQSLLRRIRNGEDPSAMWGHTTEADLRDRCEKLDSMFEAMSEFGYKSQAELLTERWKDPMASRPRRESYRKINGEVAVNIDRNGEFIFYDGRHRLALAKIVGVDTIPVVVLVRHRRWQRTRDEILRGAADGVPSHLEEHPDIDP
jgi:hypothetical protein